MWRGSEKGRILLLQNRGRRKRPQHHRRLSDTAEAGRGREGWRASPQAAARNMRPYHSPDRNSHQEVRYEAGH